MNLLSGTFTSLSLLLAVFISAQPAQTEAERKLYQQNKIKVIEINSLKLNRDIDKRTFLDERIKIDREGHILEQTYYDSTGLEMLKWTNCWQGAHQTDRIFCIYRDTIAKTHMTYNEKGFPLTEWTENPDGLPLCKFNFTCDVKGRITESAEEVFPEFQAYLKQAYKHDLQGYMILRYMDESKGHVKLHYKYGYTKDGQLEKVTEMRQDTVDYGFVNTEYTKKGFRKGYTVKNLNGKKFRCFYEFDPHGYLKEEAKFYSVNTLNLDQEHNSYVTDSHGNIKKRLRYRANNELYMLYNYSYEYWE
ncbi:MAG TPA: hypothetical protein VNZ86_20525 [Bacteroidia bacterium]|jgi:hypothetical protein|nr:hypothetical protein [Bacteroidia bacterium]